MIRHHRYYLYCYLHHRLLYQYDLWIYNHYPTNVLWTYVLAVIPLVCHYCVQSVFVLRLFDCLDKYLKVIWVIFFWFVFDICFWFFFEEEEDYVKALYISECRLYYTRTNNLPRKASTWLDMPLIAFRKICGNITKQGWWNVSTPSARDTTHCMNWGVLLITCGEHRSMGEPMVRKNRYHVWAMQSLVMPVGINNASSSTTT